MDQQPLGVQQREREEGHHPREYQPSRETQQQWEYQPSREYQPPWEYQPSRGYQPPSSSSTCRSTSSSTPAPRHRSHMVASAGSPTGGHRITAGTHPLDHVAPTTPTPRHKREAATVTTPSNISRTGSAPTTDEPTNSAIMGMLQQLLQQSAQAQTDTHAMLGVLHTRADTTDRRIQQLADATDDRLKDIEERMTTAELTTVPDDRTAQTVQLIHNEQERVRQRMEHQQKEQANF